jgi:hypothetical protein
MRFLLGSVTLTVIAVSMLACQRDPTGRDGGLRASEFVEIIVAIRTAEREVLRDAEPGTPPDSVRARFERSRDEILQRHGATEESLLRFVDDHHARPRVMAAVWDSITNRLRTPPDQVEEGYRQEWDDGVTEYPVPGWTPEDLPE